MRSVFLGDAHLVAPAGEGHRRLVTFLDRLEADRLFVMGDLFDFLFGTRRAGPGHAAPVLDALHGVAGRGVPVTYLEGNHDLHLRPLLDERIELWEGPGDVQLGDLRIHLAHGDEVQRRDLGYALLRPAVRTELFAAVVTLLGPGRLMLAGQRSAQTSRDMRAGRSRNWRDEKLRYVRHHTIRGADLVVLGHSHQLFFERVGEGTVAQIGRFDVRDQHVILDGRRLQLREGDRVVMEWEV